MTVTVRPFEARDKEGILDSCEKVWGSDTRFCVDVLWDWRHGWDDSAMSREHQCSKVLLKEGKIIGYGGMMPVEFMVDNRLEYGGTLMDIYVDPDDRGPGLELMKNLIFARGIHYGLAMPRLKELCARILKLEDIAIRYIMKRFLFVDPISLFSKKLPPLIAQPLSRVWKLYTSVRCLIFAPSMPEGYTIRQVTSFANDIDAVWQQFTSQFRFSLLRNAEYLNWRFVEAPYSYKKLLLHDRSKIVGCIIFRKALFNDSPIIIVAEAFAIEQSEKNYLLLLNQVYQYAKENGVSRIGTMDTGCVVFKRALDKMGFFSRVHQSMPVIGSWVVSSKPSRIIYDRTGWYISPADSDLELMVFDQLQKKALEYAIDLP